VIWREAFRFALVGAAQLALDWTVFVAVSAAGLPTVASNVAGRFSGACLGYVANGRYTFASRRRASLDKATLARFVTLWLATTALSTAAVAYVDQHLGLGVAWLLKPLIDAALVGASFVASRHWVYR
jgi:putative flippase GtrA